MLDTTSAKKTGSRNLLLQPCTGCGACAALCPSGAIELDLETNKGLFLPKIDSSKCKECGICQEVCPSFDLDDTQLNDIYINKAAPTLLLGEYLSCYIGNATDDFINHVATSGGLVTQLLIFALETGAINGAVVTRMRHDNPLCPETFIARTKEEIIEAATSKYCPVPLNYILKTILECNDEKIAVVGLPCHILAFKKAENLYPVLKQKIGLYMGIFCSHNDSFHGTKFVLDKSKIYKGELLKFMYRGEGWPGGIKAKCYSGFEFNIPLETPLWRSFHDSLFFAPPSCFACSDLTCEKADISFGDAWLPEVKETERIGKSVIICRTQRGQTLLDDGIGAGVIQLGPLAPWDVVRSQKRFIHFKKINILVRQKNKEIGSFHISRINHVVSHMAQLSQFLGANALGRTLLTRMPSSILDKYVRLFYKIYSSAIRNDFTMLEEERD